MKAKLEFDLDDHSDRLAHKRCVSATDVYIALHRIDSDLREIYKYDKGIAPGDKIALEDGWHELTEKESEILHAIVSNIRNSMGIIIDDAGVNLDDLE
jgi:hypothetical protein